MTRLTDRSGPWMPSHMITPNMAIHVEALEHEALALAKAGPTSPDAELQVQDMVKFAKMVHVVDSIILKIVYLDGAHTDEPDER